MLKSKKIFFDIKKYFLVNWKSVAYLAPILIFLIIFILLTIIKSYVESFRVFSEFDKTRFNIGIDNYKNVIADPQFKSAISNSTFLIFLVTPISLFLGFSLALLLNSLIFRWSKNILITAFYSQFFISSFAIGVSFIFLFGEQNAFSKIFNLNISFGVGENSIGFLWVYFLFQLWRSLPFNLVIFSFAISKMNLKYKTIFILDNISLWQKIKYVYYHEINKTFLNVAYTNIAFSAFLVPYGIIDLDLDSLRGHTLSSYIFSYLNPQNLNINLDFQLAYAASIISLGYILFLVILLNFTRPSTILFFINVTKKITSKFKHQEQRV
ncbi:multiple sugar transport system permease protein [Mycoplasma testudineum]|uniref:Multiple sugar transport system permease protein n=1 Tax=Mycoplasma testudineum TaxID=244584 RepID=A0A4R6IEW3_9MOLU|nr:sugar ABC transporter permease [Mycoplasma testudineum]OYD26619.1 ABC transporter permease [Mycoplasma testudineum]TDO19455.1 multiple sugar transport system permease protein [Mycoplasma testudineum]